MNTRSAKKEARGETGVEPRAAAPREQPARRRRQAVPKRPYGSTSTIEPGSTSTVELAPKKTRKDLGAEASMSEVVTSGVAEQREEEEKEDEIPLVRPRGLRSRGPAILEEGDLADDPTATDEAEQLEADLVGRNDVEIPGVST